MKKVTKRLIISAVIIAIFFAASRFLLGFSILRMPAAIEMSASIGAKIACSGMYITGLKHTQILDDIASYSPVLSLLEITNHENTKTVTANFYGLSKQSASYRPGIGCTLDIGDTSPLDALRNPALASNEKIWPYGNGSGDTIEPALQAQLDAMLALDNNEGRQTRALLVIKNSQIVAESYAEGFDKNTQFLGWSMGKSLVAIMFGRLQKMGLAQETQITNFPQWQQDSRKNITLEHLLTMSSGLAFDETYAPGTDATNMLFHAHSASDVAIDAPQSRPAGDYFSYSSGTTNILSRWMHDQLGGSQAQLDFLRNQLLAPLHMNNTLMEVDPSGVFVGSSYIYASARDWARLGLLLLNQGSFNGQQLLSEEFVKKAQTPISADNYQKYGYHFWLNTSATDRRWQSIPEDAFMMKGNREQIVLMVPSQNTLIVRLGWSSNRYPLEENFSTLLTAD